MNKFLAAVLFEKGINLLGCFKGKIHAGNEMKIGIVLSCGGFEQAKLGFYSAEGSPSVAYAIGKENARFFRNGEKTIEVKVANLFVDVDVNVVLLKIEQLYYHFKKFKFVMCDYEISVLVQNITSKKYFTKKTIKLQQLFYGYYF